MTLTKLKIVPGDVSGGSVYCLTAVNGTASRPTTVGAVKASGLTVRATYPVATAFPATLTLSVGGLVPSKL